ncbi:MAG TPA: hypothetical protein VG347_02455 [Verrucomicrobiae bacterium]|nr:hypothetical protein [Verrucomicrobiae bacterium]
MKIRQGKELTSVGLVFDFPPKGKVRLNQPGNLFRGITIGLGFGLLAAVTGCIGWVDEDGYYGGAVMAPQPDFYFFGDYGWGRDWHGYSHRGHESRGAAHLGSGGHAGGGGHTGGGSHGGGHGGRH